MSDPWPSLHVLELLVAIAEEGSVGAGARRVGMAQPNASRAMARLESQLGTALLDRTPRGSRPTPEGLVLVGQARDVLDAARLFNDLLEQGTTAPVAPRLRVGASMTIADGLLPSWLAQLRRRTPRLRIDLQVLNSEQVLDAVRAGALQLGFVETPQPPTGVNAEIVHHDELVVVVAPDHPWARRRSKISQRELARTPLVVREPGSGTREALDEVLAGLSPVEPAQVLRSNAAVRVAVASGHAPAALSKLAVRSQLANGELLQVPLEVPVIRPLTAIWGGPRRLTGPAADLVGIARQTAEAGGGAISEDAGPAG